MVQSVLFYGLELSNSFTLLIISVGLYLLCPLVMLPFSIVEITFCERFDSKDIFRYFKLFKLADYVLYFLKLLLYIVPYLIPMALAVLLQETYKSTAIKAAVVANFLYYFFTIVWYCDVAEKVKNTITQKKLK